MQKSTWTLSALLACCFACGPSTPPARTGTPKTPKKAPRLSGADAALIGMPTTPPPERTEHAIKPLAPPVPAAPRTMGNTVVSQITAAGARSALTFFVQPKKWPFIAKQLLPFAAGNRGASIFTQRDPWLALGAFLQHALRIRGGWTSALASWDTSRPVVISMFLHQRSRTQHAVTMGLVTQPRHVLHRDVRLRFLLPSKDAKATLQSLAEAMGKRIKAQKSPHARVRVFRKRRGFLVLVQEADHVRVEIGQPILPRGSKRVFAAIRALVASPEKAALPATAALSLLQENSQNPVSIHVRPSGWRALAEQMAAHEVASSTGAMASRYSRYRLKRGLTTGLMSATMLLDKKEIEDIALTLQKEPGNKPYGRAYAVVSLTENGERLFDLGTGGKYQLALPGGHTFSFWLALDFVKIALASTMPPALLEFPQKMRSHLFGSAGILPVFQLLLQQPVGLANWIARYPMAKSFGGISPMTAMALPDAIGMQFDLSRRSVDLSAVAMSSRATPNDLKKVLSLFVSRGAPRFMRRQLKQNVQLKSNKPAMFVMGANPTFAKAKRRRGALVGEARFDLEALVTVMRSYQRRFFGPIAARYKTLFGRVYYRKKQHALLAELQFGLRGKPKRSRIPRFNGTKLAADRATPQQLCLMRVAMTMLAPSYSSYLKRSTDKGKPDKMASLLDATPHMFCALSGPSKAGKQRARAWLAMTSSLLASRMPQLQKQQKTRASAFLANACKHGIKAGCNVPKPSSVQIVLAKASEGAGKPFSALALDMAARIGFIAPSNRLPASAPNVLAIDAHVSFKRLRAYLKWSLGKRKSRRIRVLYMNRKKRVQLALHVGENTDPSCQCKQPDKALRFDVQRNRVQIFQGTKKLHEVAARASWRPHPDPDLPALRAIIARLFGNPLCRKGCNPLAVTVHDDVRWSQLLPVLELIGAKGSHWRVSGRIIVAL